MPFAPDDDARRADVSRLLDQLVAVATAEGSAGTTEAGQQLAVDRLTGILYEDLRRIASAYLSRERAGHSLSPTDLVHEAYGRLVDQERVNWQGKTHFLGIAAQAMRRLLVDHARRKLTDKRGGDWYRVTLEPVGTDALKNGELDHEQLLALDTALEKLAELDPRQATIVEMRYFGGMSVPEIAVALGIGRRTVDRDWKHARSWLKRELAHR